MNSTADQTPVPWLILFSRLVLFAIVQALIAFVFLLLGVSDAWSESARWWVFSAIVTNIVSILLLIRLFRAEGKRYLNILHFERKTFWTDLALAIGVSLLGALFAIIPSNALAQMMFGSSNTPMAMMFRTLPGWAILVGFLFPVTIAFAELPTYFGYAMPRLEQKLSNGWLAWALASLFLSLQHMTLPLILDWRFIVWRALQFLPLVLYMGWVLKVRPRLLPYLAVTHFLVDLSALSRYFTL